MKRAAAFALAGVLEADELAEDKILPDAFDSRVAPAVAEADSDAWKGNE